MSHDVIRDSWPEYQMVAEFYGDRRAQRSQLPLINHIHEGVKILWRRNWQANNDFRPMRAFCLHPLIQSDQMLKIARHSFWTRLMCLSPEVLMFAMEYRNVANQSLSDIIDDNMQLKRPIKLSPIKEVNEMLVADKVQNYKDFLRYNKETHPRAGQLDAYFTEWLDALGVLEQDFAELIRGL